MPQAACSGRKLELIVYDDQGKADQSIPLANKMIGQDKVAVAVSGGYSLPTRAAAPVFQKAGIPYFAAYAVHPDVTTGGNWAFRGVTLGPPQGAVAAKFIADEFGKKRVSVITMDNDFGQSIADGFKKAAPGKWASRCSRNTPTACRSASSAPSSRRSRPTSRT